MKEAAAPVDDTEVDGQPVDAKAWNQPDPFTPVIRDERIYARSASDDKGPIIATLAMLVSARGLAGGLALTAPAGANGRFLIASLVPGTHDLVVDTLSDLNRAEADGGGIVAEGGEEDEETQQKNRSADPPTAHTERSHGYQGPGRNEV